MAQILDIQGLQHYANKMCNADNRKVGTKSLPTTLNEIDTAIDGFKKLFEQEYGSPVNMEIVNNKNVFTVGTGIDIDKKDDVENSFTDLKISGNSMLNCIKEGAFSNPSNFFESENNPVINGGEITLVSKGNVNQTRFSLKPSQGIIKPNTKYTLVFDVLKNTLSGQMYLTYTNNGSVCVSYFPFQNSIDKKATGRFKYVLTSANTNIEQINCLFRTMIWNDSVAGESITFTVRIFEGDWTNKEIPEYFEGLKSVGNKENDNNRINIWSENKNILEDTSEFENTNKWQIMRGKIIEGYNGNKGYFMNYQSTDTSGYSDILSQKITDAKYKNNQILEDSWYTFSFYAKGGKVTTYIYPRIVNENVIGIVNGIECKIPIDGAIHHTLTSDWKRYTVTFKTKSSFPSISPGGNHVLFRMFSSYADCVVSSIMIEPGKVATDYVSQITEKKEILLNKPLRGLPNGIKDTIEKVNGEWKIIRRCAKETLNGQELGWTPHTSLSGTNVMFFHINTKSSVSISTGAIKKDSSIRHIQSDSIACYAMIDRVNNRDKNIEGIYYSDSSNPLIQIHINKSKLISHDISGFTKWLSQNPVTVLYELENYIIEDIDPITLQCWKNGTISIVDEVMPVETTHTVALNKSAQIQKNIEELTSLRNRVEMLEEQYNKTALNQAYETELLKLDMKLDNII